MTDSARQIDMFPAKGPVELMGGAYEGASRQDRKMLSWTPPTRSADGDVLPEKRTMDARVLDTVRNDAFSAAGVQFHKDAIVGAQYRLNCKPHYKALGLDAIWAKEFAEEVEAKFTLWAESDIDKWVDASRRNTFTGLIRLAVGTMVHSGEILATAEWLREGVRPYRTAIQMVELNRLSNPLNQNFDKTRTRGGIRFSAYGEPLGYWIRRSLPSAYIDPTRALSWSYVRARGMLGRPQVIHIVEQERAGQSRGVSRLVAALKESRMTRNWRDVMLENAVVNASFAAAVESELPSTQVFEALGSGGTGIGEAVSDYAVSYLKTIAEFGESARNMKVNGVRIPHLVPGTKLNLQPAGKGESDVAYENSLLRYLAASFDMSLEEYTKDWSQTNYSAAKAAGVSIGRGMKSKKRLAADGTATTIYRLWFEEAVNAGSIMTMLGRSVPNMYEGTNMTAYTRCQWLGAGQGQIDEFKETQAAVLRLKSGLTTFENECGRLGYDWRVILEQRMREEEAMKEIGLEVMLPDLSGTGSAQEDKSNGNGNGTGSS